MGKLVVLNLLEGNFEEGFPAILEIGEDGARPKSALRGLLPPATHIPESFRKWQAAFRDKVNPSPNEQSANRSRITPRRVTQFSCDESAKELAAHLNVWLNFGNGKWQPIRDGLQRNLSTDDEIRVIIQTKDIQLRRLPWQVWDLFADRYTNAEIAFSEPNYESPSKMPSIQRQSKVRILVLLGRRDDINIQFDQQVLKDLRHRGAEIEILDQPERYKLIEKLWDSQGWHIFFFAGHSSSQEDGQIGWIDINPNDSLAIDEFKNSLRNAIKRGLQLAIFNSCDGLGLANQLSKLHLPQSIVMREPVPDQVAQEFLQNFLTAFANNKSFYVSVHEARERLEGWEKQYAGVSWLPVICQNPAVVPPTWRDFCSMRESTDQYVGSTETCKDRNSIPLFPKELPQEEYIRLKNLLAAGRWREANETTRTIILKAVSREKEGWLADEQIQNFPCQVLHIVDSLWVQYSNGRFGFSVQKRICNECKKDPQAFGDRVGWHVQEAWISASQVIYTPVNAPQGHLPWGIMQVVTMDNAALDAFVYGLRAATKKVARHDWQKQLLADFMALGGFFLGDRIDKEEFKRDLEYELSHDQAWWEGARLEELKVCKLFSLLVSCLNL